MTSLTTRTLVPLANESDAERTARAIRRWIPDDEPTPAILAIHVIEKGGGAPDKAPMGARKEQAERIFEIVDAELSDASFQVETEIRYGTDVVDTIHESARDMEATSIAFLPQEGGLLMRVLTGNLTSNLVRDAPIPVVTLPAVADE